MSAITRWIQYDTTSAGEAGTGGVSAHGQGTRGKCVATASVADTFDITSSSNRLWLNIDGLPVGNTYITLTSGTNLDPRFVAKDITEKLHNLGRNEVGYDQSQCVWENGSFIIYAGSLGTSSSVSVVSGSNTAHLELGFGTKSEVGGLVHSYKTSPGNAYNGGIVVSGTYNGFFDEIYRVVLNKEISIGTPSKGGSNTYTGVLTTGGAYNYSTATTYTLYINTTNGTTMGAGYDNVPKLSWVSSDGLDDGGPVQLLYSNYWYNVGTRGLMVKFSDAVFNNCTAPNAAWTIVCAAVQYVQGTNASAPESTAMYIWGSSRGDDATTAEVTSSGSYTVLGSRGLSVRFTGTNNFTAGDEFYVICTPPQPQSYNITNLNYGNVTVSTESPVRAVAFEIMSGAVEISTVKFGLQSKGSFQHHNAGNSDTKFRFGTVGPGNVAGAAPIDGLEWRTSVAAADISSDTPPAYLFATKQNLSVVSDADSSESIGVSTYAGLCADPIWLNVKLGSSEVGANSTINYRIYFDYS